MTAEPPPSASAGPRFVGRVDELRDLLDALGPRSRAVVHCSSPGGVGKTCQPGEFEMLLGDVTSRVFGAYDDATVV